MPRRHLRILAGTAAIVPRQRVEDDAAAMADQAQVVPPPKSEIQMLKVHMGSRLLHEQCFGMAGEDVQAASGQNGSVNAHKEKQGIMDMVCLCDIRCLLVEFGL